MQYVTKPKSTQIMAAALFSVGVWLVAPQAIAGIPACPPPDGGSDMMEILGPAGNYVPGTCKWLGESEGENIEFLGVDQSWLNLNPIPGYTRIYDFGTTVASDFFGIVQVTAGVYDLGFQSGGETTAITVSPFFVGGLANTFEEPPEGELAIYDGTQYLNPDKVSQGYTLKFVSFDVTGGNGNGDIHLPEPGTLTLLGIGLLPLVRARIRKTSA